MLCSGRVLHFAVLPRGNSNTCLPVEPFLTRQDEPFDLISGGDTLSILSTGLKI